MSLVFSDGGRTLRYEAVGSTAEVFGNSQFLLLFDRFFGGGRVGEEVVGSGDGCLRFLGCGTCDISGGGSDGVVGEQGGDACLGVKSGDLRACVGIVEGSAVAGVETGGGDIRDRGRVGYVGIDSKVGAGSVAGGDGKDMRGKHYLKNKAKRAKRRMMNENWRENRGVDGSGGCVSDVSDSCTVRTVDTRTAVEVEAAQSLAVRRVAENKVATALAAHKLRVLQDKDRTAMVDRLAAARGEQRINEAKAKSQSSFKKCDQSLKSLGSSGSAGEFALKQEVKKAKDNETLRIYVEAQLKLALKYASPDVHQMIAAMPPPVLQDEFEAFGECPSEFDEEEQQAYFDDLNRRNEENFDKCATYC